MRDRDRPRRGPNALDEKDYESPEAARYTIYRGEISDGMAGG